jgi:hypothetical protein
MNARQPRLDQLSPKSTGVFAWKGHSFTNSVNFNLIRRRRFCCAMANMNQWMKRGDVWCESVTIGPAASLTLSLPPKITLALRDTYRGIAFK